MAEIALGWLGWTEEQALAADVNAILAGFAGKQDMWQSVFGGGKKQDPAALPAAGAGMFGKAKA